MLPLASALVTFGSRYEECVLRLHAMSLRDHSLFDASFAVRAGYVRHFDWHERRDSVERFTWRC